MHILLLVKYVLDRMLTVCAKVIDVKYWGQLMAKSRQSFDLIQVLSSVKSTDGVDYKVQKLVRFAKIMSIFDGCVTNFGMETEES